jgi:hypothetical protein
LVLHLQQTILFQYPQVMLYHLAALPLEMLAVLAPPVMPPVLEQATVVLGEEVQEV